MEGRSFAPQERAWLSLLSWGCNHEALLPLPHAAYALQAQQWHFPSGIYWWLLFSPNLVSIPPQQPLPQELLFEMLGAGTSAIGALLQKDASSLITGLISSQRPPGTDGCSGKI